MPFALYVDVPDIVHSMSPDFGAKASGASSPAIRPSQGPNWAPGGSTPPESGVAIAVTALRHRWRIAAAAIVMGTILALPALVERRVFTSQSSFLPQASPAEASRMSGFAAQFGLMLPGGSRAESPEFFVALARSRDVLTDLVAMSFAALPDSPPRPLLDVLEIVGRSPEERRENGILRLRRMISAQPNIKTGVVLLSVTTPTPTLSRSISDSVLALVNRFNLERRQTSAGAERRFVEERLGQVRSELRLREDSLRVFLLQNRGTLSPNVSFVRDRLQQEVDLRRTLFTNLSQAYEQARIEEVRNTPVISIVEHPHLPVRPDSRRVAIKALAGLVAGILFGVLWVVIQDRLAARRRMGDPEVSELSAQLHETLADIRHPVRRLRGD